MPEPKQGPASATTAPEPLAAILADYRADITAMMRGELYDPTPEYLRILLDRVEAAYKREHADTIYAGRNGEMTLDECIVRCDNNSGDNPRGRDVAQIGGWLRELRERRRAPGNAAAMREALERIVGWCEGCHADACEKVCRPELTSESIHAALAALAAPARNADRFADPGEAWLAYKAECEKDETVPNMIGAISWLLAPADGGAKCVDGLRGDPDCRGCDEHCLDVRKRNCFYWNPDIGKCALDGKPSCRIACDNFHVSKEEKPATAEGGAE